MVKTLLRSLPITRRLFLASAAAGALASTGFGADKKRPRVLLRSSWQTVKIGDIAHTPGMLALLERHKPDAEITLWPNPLGEEVEKLLTTRFPKLRIARTKAEQDAALENCDFFLHGSGPSLVGLSGPKLGFGPDATFALDLRDDEAAARLLMQHKLEAGKFLCAVPRLRWTPYWEIHPERVKPNPERIAINEKFAEPDHAKLREAITAWVREVKLRVFLVPEMTYEVSRLRPLLFDPLPADVKPHVAVMDRYWLTAAAASVYARAAAVLSFELHSPIMAIAAGTPAVHLRQPTDTSKGQMWRDVGLDSWLFEIDDSTGSQLAARIVAIGRDLPAARTVAGKARTYAQERMAAMMAAIG